jgi:hypothetical protein
MVFKPAALPWNIFILAHLGTVLDHALVSALIFSE